RAPGRLRADRRGADGRRPARRLPPPAAPVAYARDRLDRAAARRARDRARDQRCATVDLPRTRRLPAFRAREARACVVGGRLSVAPPSAAVAARAVASRRG